MATDTEVRTWFTADTSGLESADKKQEALAKKAMAREREFNAEAKRGADARRKLGDTVASSLTGPLGSAGQAGGVLLDKLKGLGPVGGLAAAGLALVGKVAMAARKEITASADALRDLNEEYRQGNNANRFSSAGEGTSALAARLRGTNELASKSRAASMERDPYGFDTEPNQNFGTRMDLALTKMMQPLANFLADPTGEDREKSEKGLARQAERQNVQQRRKIRGQLVESVDTDLSITRERFKDPKEAEIIGLTQAKTKAIEDAKTAGITDLQTLEKIGEQYQTQIDFLRERQEYDLFHQRDEMALIGLRERNVSAEVRSLDAAKMVAKTARQELDTRQNLTEEERRGLLQREANAKADVTGIGFARAERNRSIYTDTQSTRLRLGVSTGEADVYNLQVAKDQALRQAAKDDVGAPGMKRIAGGFDLQIRNAQNEVAIAGQRFNLARQIQQVESANTSEVQQRYRVTQLQTDALRQELSTRRGLLTLERAREIALSAGDNREAVRKIRQEVGYGKSESQIMNDLRQSATQKRLLDRFDARTADRDGLIRVQKDLSGNITGGIDMVTGRYRGVSEEFKRGILKKGSSGHDDDVNKGSTMLDAARATVDAIDISNAYLRNISNQIDKLGLA